MLTKEEFAFCTARVPRACVDVGLVHQGKILLLHRRISPCQGAWALCGGSIYKGEEAETAAVRKVQEELGISLEPSMLELVGSGSFFPEARHDVVLVFRALLPDPVEVKLDYQHDDHRWFDFGALPADLIPSVRKELSIIAGPRFSLAHEDPRGALYQLLLPTGQEVLLFFSKAGSWRGGHSHDVPEITLLLTGRMRYYKRIGDKEKTEELSAGQADWHPGGQVHMAEFLGDSWLIDWKVGCRVGEAKTTDYEPYRERVREAMR